MGKEDVVEVTGSCGVLSVCLSVYPSIHPSIYFLGIKLTKTHVASVSWTLLTLAVFGLRGPCLEWELSIVDLREDKGEPWSAQGPFS